MRACVFAPLFLGAAADLEWDDFKAKFNRHFTGAGHEDARQAIFRENLARIEEHNEKVSTYQLGVNEFSDMTFEEFAATHTGFVKPSHLWGGANKLGTHYAGANENLASSVDWVSAGAVTPVKNQGSCGSCWAFSTTGALEGAWQLATGNLVGLSEQQFVDCDKGNGGCQGGFMDDAFKYAEGVDVCSEESYPYKTFQIFHSCKASSCTAVIPKGGVSGFTDVASSSNDLMSALNRQPVSVAVQASGAIQSYGKGVLQKTCGSNLDHGVLAVGYGTDGVDYWKVKNSWGSSWGESGYFRLIRGIGGDGECGILLASSFPTVSSGVSV